MRKGRRQGARGFLSPVKKGEDMPLKVEMTEKQKGIFTFALKGSLDSLTYIGVGQRFETIFQPSTKALILDMRGVEYVSTLGINLILRTKDRIESLGGVFIMTGLRPYVEHIFEIIKAIPTMNVFESI
jgi:anti-anti-sigma factor